MKILVTVKRVPNPEQKLKFAGDKLDLSSASWVFNAFDEYAVETALRLTESGPNGERTGEVVVATVAPSDASQQLRAALAMGASRAILVKADDATLDSFQVARVFKALVDKEKPDIVILGKQAVDSDSNQVPQMLAGLLGWPQATFAANVELAADGKSLTVGREVDSGVETKEIPLPGILSCDLRVIAPAAVKNNKGGAGAYEEGPRYASLKGIMAAKKKELAEMTFADLGVAAEQREKWLKVEAPPARAAGVKVGSVAELVKKLHEEAKVI